MDCTWQYLRDGFLHDLPFPRQMVVLCAEVVPHQSAGSALYLADRFAQPCPGTTPRHEVSRPRFTPS